MRKLLLTAFALSLAAPALAAQQDIAQISAVTASREALRTAVNTQLSAVQANFDEVYAAIGTRPWVIQATAPADTTLAWFDTDQVVDAVVLKIHNGERWVPQAIGEGGSYTIPTAAADTLGGVKVGARLTITDGVLSADVQTTDISGKENSLGNPSTSGYVLSSTTSGVRSWIEMTGGGTGIAHATSDGNYYASKDGGWASLAGVFLAPTGSADSLTITDTGTYFTTDTVGAALQELGGAPELLFGTEFTETKATGTVTVTLDYPVTSETYGSSWSADTDGAQRDDIYAILHVGDTDDDGMADKLDLASAGFVKVNSSGVISSVKEKEYIGWSVVNSDTATAVADGKMGAAVPAGMNEMNLTDVTCSVAALNAAASGATTAVIRRVRLGSRMGDDTSQFDLTFSTPNVTVTWDSTGTDPGISSSTLAAGDEVDISGFETAANNGHFTVATVGANYITFANAAGVENLNDVGVTITPIRHRDMTSTGVTIEYGDYTASDEVIDTSNDDLATGDNLYVDISAVTTPAQKGLLCTATFEAQ